MAQSIEQRPVTTESLRRRIEALEAELAAARAREQDLADFVDNAVLGLHKVGPDGTILWANRADYESLGYRAEEYIGRNIADFHVDVDNLQCILSSLLGGEALRDHGAELRCKDGSTRQVLISSNGHFEDGRFVNTRCFTRDVTGQRLAEAALHEARHHLAAIVESSEDAIIACDLEGRVTAWNPGAEQLFGYSREEMLGRALLDIIPPELRDEERDILARIESGGRIRHYETRRVRKDGTVVEISLGVSALRDAAGRLIGVAKVGRDITERNRVQRELADMARRKDEFLAILSHELRNPLAPIRYALSIFSQAGAGPEQRRRAEEVVVRQVEQMARLLDDLLDVSRIARGRVELRRKHMDLTSAVGAAIDAARPLLDQKRHALTLDLPAEPLRLTADPVRITQILTNLLTNAAKYTPPGGRIHLSTRRDGEFITISVRDNGMGIPAQMLPRLFTLFSQAGPAIKRSEGGLGIGLALVKSFVELHGGRVEVRSAGEGHGSEFTVRLPLGSARPSMQSPIDPWNADTAARLRVLIADDNIDSAQTCAVLLRLWGHEVRVAHSGEEALQMASAFEPQVALIDIGMPGMSGYEVARALRATPCGARAVLVAVTGWGQDEDRQQAADSGFDHHLTKPVEPSRLQALLSMPVAA